MILCDNEFIQQILSAWPFCLQHYNVKTKRSLMYQNLCVMARSKLTCMVVEHNLLLQCFLWRDKREFSTIHSASGAVILKSFGENRNINMYDDTMKMKTRADIEETENNIFALLIVTQFLTIWMMTNSLWAIKQCKYF